MQGKVKITKRQIKEDSFTTFMLTTKEQFAANWQLVVIGLVIVVLTVVAIVYYINSQQARTAEAGQQFAQALGNARGGDRQVAILELTQIVEEYGNDNVAEEATYLLGKLNFIDRNYSESIRYYEMYLAKYRDNPLNRAASFAGIAACHENQGEYVLAATRFIEAADEYPAGPLKGDYQLGAMRNFLDAGNVEAARGQLELIQKEFAGSEWATAGLRLFYEKGQIQSGT